MITYGIGCVVGQRASGISSEDADGKSTFDCEFQISDEAAEFVKAHLNKPSDELARLWIDRVRGRTRP